MRKKISWLTKLTLILVVVVFVGFIPWESWFPMEIKNHTLREIAEYGLGFSALFLLTIVAFIFLARRFTGKMRMIVYVLLPVLLIGIFYIGMVFSFISGWGGWEDYRIYRNDNSYLVLEIYEAPGSDVEPEYSNLRFVRTKSPLSMVRWNAAVYPLNQNKDVYIKAKKKLDFAGEIWYAVADF